MKILILALFSALSSLLYSQGNLQFNQVKLVSAVETVPAGKVWKVEGAIFSGGAPFGVSTYTLGSMSYAINGINCIIANSLAGAGSTINNAPVHDNAFPFWLPVGSTLSAGNNMRYLSVIEFNVVP
jgi:hypothetical protein